jgi:hypothetical protein
VHVTRALARISQDEVARMVKAVRSCGLTIARITYDGKRVDVIIGDSGEKPAEPVDEEPERPRLLREPQP